MKAKTMIYSILILSQAIKTLEIGLQINAHVRLSQNNQPEVFSQIFTKTEDDRRQKVDIFMTYKNQIDEDMIRYINCPHFDPTLPMSVVVCPQTKDINAFQNLQETQQNCKVDLNTNIFFDQTLEAYVQYQRTQDKQRYTYGGLNYLTGLLGSEQIQNPQKQQLIKQLFKQQLEKVHNKDLMNIDNEEQEVDEIYKTILLDKTLQNNIKYFQFLKRLSQNQQQHEQCKINIIGIESQNIKNIQMRSTNNSNFLFLMVDKEINDVDIQLGEQILNDNLLQKQIQNFGSIQHEQLFAIQDEQSINLKLGLKNKQNGIAFTISENDQQQQNDTNNKYMNVNELKHISNPIQVMACSGMQFLKDDNNLNKMQKLNSLNCEKIHQLDNILIENQNNLQNIKQRLQQNDLQINNFKLQSIRVIDSQQLQKLQIKGFRQNCDLLLDNILGTLFVLCYLVYSHQGQFFQFVDDVQSQNVNQQSEQATLDLNKLASLELSKISNKRRILSGKLGPYGKFWANLFLCPCMTIINIIFFMCVACKCTDEKYELLLIDRARRVLIKNQEQDQQFQGLVLDSFKQIDNLVQQFNVPSDERDQSQSMVQRLNGEISTLELQQILQQQGELTDLLNRNILAMKAQMTQVQEEDQEIVQIQGEQVDLNGLKDEVIKAEENLEIKLSKSKNSEFLI